MVYRLGKIGTSVVFGLGFIALLITLFLLPSSLTHATSSGILCVVPPGQATGPYASCDQVFTTVQSAVDNAAEEAEIWVAAGVYTGTQNRNGLVQMVVISRPLTIRGGYMPPFNTLPDPEENLTVLNAEEQGRVMVITHTDGVVIEGLTLTGGNATGLGGPGSGDAGGGVYAVSTTLTLRDNHIYSNTATTASSHSYGYGGGVALYQSNGTLISNRIERNLTGHSGYNRGGGIYIEESRALTVSNNVIHNNSASLTSFRDNGGGFGGGLYVNSSYLSKESTILLLDNTISSNKATVYGENGMGGGLYLESYDALSSTITLQGNRILSNTALVSETYDGSGVDHALAFGGGVSVGGQHILFKNNQIAYNATVISRSESSTSGLGGGVIMYNSHASMEGDRIQDNDAGGVGGGFFIQGDSVVTLTNAVIADNSAFVGAGLDISERSYVTLRHATIRRNEGVGAIVVGGGGMTNTVVVSNSIIASHDVGVGVASMSTVIVDGVMWYDTPVLVDADVTAAVTITYAFVGDPLFAPDGYHLMPGSAAINRGQMNEVRVDIDNEPRDRLPDLGADEYWAQHLFLPILLNGQ